MFGQPQKMKIGEIVEDRAAAAMPTAPR